MKLSYIINRIEESSNNDIYKEYKIVPDKKFNDKKLSVKGKELKRFFVKDGSKISYFISDKPDGFTCGSYSGAGKSFFEYGPYPKFEIAVARIAALISDTLNSFGEKYDVTPKKTGSEYTTIVVTEL